MRALRSYSWIAGFVMLSAGMSLFLVSPEQRPWAIALTASGALLVAVGIALNFADILALLGGRPARFGASAVLYSLIVLMILGAANFLSSRHRVRFDLTEGGAHTLAPQSVHLLEALDTDVEVIGFFTQARMDARRKFEDLMEEYRYHSARLRVRVVDPIVSPGEASLHEIVQDGTVVLESPAGKARITEITEQEMTNAILKATRSGTKSVCFTTGHGEASRVDEGAAGFARVVAALKRELYEPRDLLLLREPSVPGECEVVVVAGPTTALLPSESESIARYLEGGGRLLVLKRNPGSPTGLDGLLAENGLRVNSDTVVDRLSRAIIGDEFSPVITAYEPHPITRALSESRTATYFPVASSVEALDPEIDGVESSVVARTTDAAWGETGGVAQFDEGVDRAGPLGLVGAAYGPAGAEGDGAQRRIALFGDSDFASNGYLGMSGNVDLFLNAVGWLAEEESLLSIRAKERSPQPVTLGAGQANVLSAMVYAFPLVAVMGAVLVWSQRRRL